MTASVLLRNSIRTGVFVTAVMVALLVADEQAHADDPTQAATPAPDPGAGGAPPTPGDVTPPPSDAPPPDTSTPSTPPPSDAPRLRHQPRRSFRADRSTSRVPQLPARRRHPATRLRTRPPTCRGPRRTGSNTSQDADVTNDGTAVANTGGNTGTATAPGRWRRRPSRRDHLRHPDGQPPTVRAPSTTAASPRRSTRRSPRTGTSSSSRSRSS